MLKRIMDSGEFSNRVFVVRSNEWIKERCSVTFDNNGGTDGHLQEARNNVTISLATAPILSVCIQ